MYELDKEKAKEVMLGQDENKEMIDRILIDFDPLPDNFGPPIEHWLLFHETPDFQIDGITVSQVIINKQIPFLMAIQELSKLVDPNISDEEREIWRQVLLEPFKFL